MPALRIIAVSLAGIGCLYWLVALAMTLQGLRRIRMLAELDPPAPPRWPRLSVIIPACNEADNIEPAARDQLGGDYPDLELVLVDDRSTDGTGAIIDRLAEEDARVKAVHVEELPEAWLGKVHAMLVGRRQASGDWLLFSDADVHVAPDLLRRAVALCEAEGIDFLTAIPRFRPTNVLLDTAVTFIARAVFGGGQAWKAEDPRSRQAAGFGAFMLVRRAALDRTEGLGWLRLEVADDIGLGLLLKRSGARCAVVNARDHLSLTMFRSLEELKRSMEKGGYAIIGRYSLARVVAFSSLIPLCELGPIAGLIPVGLAWLPVLGGVGLASGLVAAVGCARWGRRPVLSGLLSPVGAALGCLFVMRSGLVGWARGGVRWRGTFYPAAVLREGVRVRFP